MLTMTCICLKGFCKKLSAKKQTILINKEGFSLPSQRDIPTIAKGNPHFFLLLAHFSRVIMFNYEHLT